MPTGGLRSVADESGACGRALSGTVNSAVGYLCSGRVILTRATWIEIGQRKGDISVSDEFVRRDQVYDFDARIILE